MNTLIELLPADWKRVLAPEFEKPYINTLSDFIEKAYNSSTCFPPKNLIFEAFKKTPFEAVKVVILGQDPYHAKGQAHGLCFSVNPGIKHPPSLQNIFKELEGDTNKAYPESGNLSHWADQGVLLLNTILTVREGAAGSHKNKGWEGFTDAVIKSLSHSNKPIIYMLWGGHAKQKKALLSTATNALILESGHPSPLSANRGYWFGNRHFSKANALLKARHMQQVDW